MALARNYYEVLGVQRNASEADIKKRIASWQKNITGYEQKETRRPRRRKKFKEVNEAYSVLSDAEKRRQYDSMGHDAFTQAASGAGPGRRLWRLRRFWRRLWRV